MNVTQTKFIKNTVPYHVKEISFVSDKNSPSSFPAQSPETVKKMKSINHFKIEALLFFFIRSIIADKILTEDNKYDKVMIPYKPVYGAPSKCTGMYDSQMTAENYRICQINAIDKWKIEMKHYYTESLNFCCFVYGVLECETKVLSKCDADYSDRNEKETRRLFDKSCQPIIANNSCGNTESKNEGQNQIWIYIGIGIGIVAMIVSIITCRYKQNKQNNLKKAAMNAYKTEKFQKIYEMESVRPIYDEEVKNLDKQWHHNVSKQMISGKGSKTFSKKDEGSTLKKWKNNIKNFFVNPDKKLKKEIKAKIDAESKNDPTFWDDFNENSEKYYKQPTGVDDVYHEMKDIPEPGNIDDAKKYMKQLKDTRKRVRNERNNLDKMLRKEVSGIEDQTNGGQAGKIGKAKNELLDKKLKQETKTIQHQDLNKQLNKDEQMNKKISTKDSFGDKKPEILTKNSLKDKKSIMNFNIKMIQKFEQEAIDQELEFEDYIRDMEKIALVNDKTITRMENKLDMEEKQLNKRIHSYNMKNPNDKKEIDEKIMNNEQQRLYQYIEEQKIKLDEMKELIRNEKKLLNEAIVERREHFYNIYNIIQNSGIDEKIQLDTDNFFVKKLLIRNIKPFFVKEYNENQTKLSSPQSSMNMDPLSQQLVCVWQEFWLLKKKINMKIIILRFQIVILLLQMIVGMNVQHEKSNDQIMIPYKTVYGVPSKCTGTSDHKTTEKEYSTCQINVIKKWKIELQHYYTDSWNFCCFVYDALKCETKVLYECDPDYSDRNDKETRRLFDKSCQPIVSKKPCGKSEDGGDDWLWKGLGIAAGVGLFLYLLYECINFWRKEYNTEFIAKEAYKAEKYRKIFEKEYDLAVYDQEMDNLNKDITQNVSIQTNNNEQSQSISKQDEVKTKEKLKKDLKKIEKKLKKEIKSQIETKSKNYPSFWDEFEKDPEKYYEQPTGVVAKSKKFFTRLWPKKDVISEEQLKREELMRLEARRQYENIRKNNRLQSDKVSTGQTEYENLIEEKNIDSISAQMLSISNQEQTTDFSKSTKMNEQEKYKKNFKDTRQNEQNQLDKKLRMVLEKPTSEDQTTKGQANKIPVERLKNEQNTLNKKLEMALEKPKISTEELERIKKNYEQKAINQENEFKNYIKEMENIVKENYVKIDRMKKNLKNEINKFSEKSYNPNKPDEMKKMEETKKDIQEKRRYIQQQIDKTNQMKASILNEKKYLDKVIKEKKKIFDSHNWWLNNEEKVDKKIEFNIIPFHVKELCFCTKKKLSSFPLQSTETKSSIKHIQQKQPDSVVVKTQKPQLQQKNSSLMMMKGKQMKSKSPSQNINIKNLIANSTANMEKQYQSKGLKVVYKPIKYRGIDNIIKPGKLWSNRIQILRESKITDDQQQSEWYCPKDKNVVELQTVFNFQNTILVPAQKKYKTQIEMKKEELNFEIERLDMEEKQLNERIYNNIGKLSQEDQIDIEQIRNDIFEQRKQIEMNRKNIENIEEKLNYDIKKCKKIQKYNEEYYERQLYSYLDNKTKPKYEYDENEDYFNKFLSPFSETVEDEQNDQNNEYEPNEDNHQKFSSPISKRSKREANNEKSLNMLQDKIMIPYKPIYGVPNKCTKTSDHQTTIENYRTCQINAIGKWKIELQHYYTDSWNFCCFVYDVLKCETKVLYECDPDYSDRNDKETRRLFDKSCQPIVAKKPCGKSEDGDLEKILTGIGIAAGVGLLLYLIYECINFWRKEYNPEFIAKEAYKAEKFRQNYEKEYIRAVYDHEVDIQDKQYFTNENGEAQPIKKQENVKIPKKDLKKIKKKINSQIEAKSKNDPSFWDEFQEDPQKYYEQPTGFKTKAKKFFTRLWPKKEVISEEQLKRDELIRSEARRQYENIRKNRLELDKISTGNESSIEEIKDDPLLAKMIPTLNQEQLDVYRETIKNTDFPESENIDQLKELTKNFIDTRNRFRNEQNLFDKTLEKLKISTEELEMIKNYEQKAINQENEFKNYIKEMENIVKENYVKIDGMKKKLKNEINTFCKKSYNPNKPDEMKKMEETKKDIQEKRQYIQQQIDKTNQMKESIPNEKNYLDKVIEERKKIFDFHNWWLNKEEKFDASVAKKEIETNVLNFIKEKLKKNIVPFHVKELSFRNDDPSTNTNSLVILNGKDINESNLQSTSEQMILSPNEKNNMIQILEKKYIQLNEKLQKIQEKETKFTIKEAKLSTLQANLCVKQVYNDEERTKIQCKKTTKYKCFTKTTKTIKQTKTIINGRRNKFKI
ncbi:hypothetical protein DERP_002410 [Dermatophagoides pteronyssinus]|uniref:Transmembrane protein n=1 Tax=Dermatophagoides pteronyssinus TaxID=6956 RepID=A0ABQ8JHM9_DERPT|nr:hypothetical protein DERP_002410 [Dermatophagoides pteronyssinus]